VRCIVISPSGAVAGTLERLGLLDSSADHTVIVSWSQPDVAAHGSRELITLGRPDAGPARAIRGALSGSAIGRNVLRISPLDGGRRLARAARRDGRLREAAATADLIVVTERDGVLTGWLAARRWAPRSAQAVYGIAAADTVIAAARAGR
jgi:hypothetical protein